MTFTQECRKLSTCPLRQLGPIIIDLSWEKSMLMENGKETNSVLARPDFITSRETADVNFPACWLHSPARFVTCDAVSEAAGCVIWKFPSIHPIAILTSQQWTGRPYARGVASLEGCKRPYDWLLKAWNAVLPTRWTGRPGWVVCCSQEGC